MALMLTLLVGLNLAAMAPSAKSRVWLAKPPYVKPAVPESAKDTFRQGVLMRIGIALREILGLSEKAEGEVVSTLKDVLERSRSRELLEE